MAIDPILLNKIKSGLIKSGFPLELNIAQKLKQRDWAYSIGNSYLDFETYKLREIDIVAEKNINGFHVNLIVECKKSEKDQLILYQTSSREKTGKNIFFSTWLKCFPKITFARDSGYKEKNIISAFKDLPLCDETQHFAKNIIFSNGDNIKQDNTSFFSSLNSIIKKSILAGSDGYVETGFRILFLHVVIYDGFILKILPNKDEIFDLVEVQYGQYEFEYKFSFPTGTNKHIIEDVIMFGEKFIIEIMTPEYFDGYIDKVTHTIESIDKDLLEGWGEDWPDVP